jgi:hypothetical protein
MRSQDTPWNNSKGGFRHDLTLPLCRHAPDKARTAAASQAVESGRCPNDGAQLVEGSCSHCRFHFTVLPPPSYTDRVGFNRRWCPKVSPKER